MAYNSIFFLKRKKKAISKNTNFQGFTITKNLAIKKKEKKFCTSQKVLIFAAHLVINVFGSLVQLVQSIPTEVGRVIRLDSSLQ